MPALAVWPQKKIVDGKYQQAFLFFSFPFLVLDDDDDDDDEDDE